MNERFVRAGAIARVHLAHEPDFALGRIEVHPARREIAGEGWAKPIDPRVMRVLVALARARGEIVSRDDLIESCWDGVIVGEDAIGACISRLRKAAEAGGNAFSVETVPRAGYRLVVAEAVARAPEARTSATPGLDSAATVPGIAPPSITQAQTPWSKRRPWAFGLAGIVAFTLVAAVLGSWWSWPRAALAPAEPVASVAVLPFVNMSGDPAKDYFSDGFAEELLDDLSDDPRLRVAARTSAFAFKGRNGDVAAIARTLHVRSIVEGSVRDFGNRVRITAELIDSGSGYRIWSARYDRDLSDILSLQDEVARAIAVALTHKILPSALKAPRPGKIDPAVYRLYLEARNQLDKFSGDGFKKGFRMLRQVTARQADFAGGWAEFSRAAWMVGPVDALHQDSTEALAHEAAARALVLDPRNFSAQAMQARLEMDDWDWSAAESHIRILRAENPNNWRLSSVVKNFYDDMGFPNEAVEAMRRAQTLDPLNDGTKKLIFFDLANAGRYRDAIAAAPAILAHHPDDPWPLEWLCQAYARTRQIRAAREVNEHLHRLKTDQLQSCQFEIDVAAGDVSGARTILNNWIVKFPDKFPDDIREASDIGNAYVELNDFDRADDWYERAYDLHEHDLFSSIFQIDQATYRQTAGFKALSQRPGFKAWQAEHDQIAAELAARHGVP